MSEPVASVSKELEVQLKAQKQEIAELRAQLLSLQSQFNQKEKQEKDIQELMSMGMLPPSAAGPTLPPSLMLNLGAPSSISSSPLTTQLSEDGSKAEEEKKEKTWKAFELKQVEVRHPFTNEVVDHETVVTIKDNQLVQYLKNSMHSDTLYATPATAKAVDIFQARNTLKQLASLPCVGELLEYLDSQYGTISKKYDSMIEQGLMTYQGLWYLFDKEKKVAGKTDINMPVAAEVNNTQYRQGIFQSFDITGSVIKANGKEFFTTTQRFRILPFEGTKPLRELPVTILTAESEKFFIERGRKFAQLATGVHYMNHRGYVAQKEGWWGYQLYKADGRVILDGVSFNRINPNSRSADVYGLNQDIFNEQSNNFEAVPEDKLYMTWPTILGFSLSAKKWGELAVSGLSEVVFDDEAYSRLVLPAEKKTLIRALVQASGDLFSDIISGKGGGCIFLLHGSPGVGKTLTAESIAELLHRPLYSVSVGELGTDTVELEKRLREILEVSSSWNAVILLDEADIFLEKRTENDITRNAMVGIFLRLLEYHQGVLFLTTNRVKCFDKAFHSRISVAIKYEDLDEAARTQIWRNLLEVAKIEGIDPAELGKFDINGRQIRTMIRLALALAKSEGVPVNKSHLERTIVVASQFNIDIEHAAD